VPDKVAIPKDWSSHKNHLSSIEEYQSMYKSSVDDPVGFWRKIAASFVWRGGESLDQTGLNFNFDRRKGPIFIEWFKGSSTNLAYNCLDKQIADGRGNQLAMINETCGNGDPTQENSGISYTYNELRAAVNKLANALRAKGVKKGDRVGIFMAHVPENCIAMLACARIGAVHSVVFGGFSKEALAGRLVDSGAKVVITQDGVMRGGKMVALKKILDDAAPLMKDSGCELEASIGIN
jgi:acetyl-CoA synthetase